MTLQKTMRIPSKSKKLALFKQEKEITLKIYYFNSLISLFLKWGEGNKVFKIEVRMEFIAP